MRKSPIDIMLNQLGLDDDTKNSVKMLQRDPHFVNSRGYLLALKQVTETKHDLRNACKFHAAGSRGRQHRDLQILHAQEHQCLRGSVLDEGTGALGGPLGKKHASKDDEESSRGPVG